MKLNEVQQEPVSGALSLMGEPHPRTHRDPGAEVTSGERPIADSLEDLIGETPLVRLRLPGAKPDVIALAKLEMCNPLSSIKDRASLFMLRAAERRGELIAGHGTIVEATSGNTGISLAALAAARGYRCVIVLPDSATRERRQILRALGAQIVLTPRAQGYAGAIEKAAELCAELPARGSHASTRTPTTSAPTSKPPARRSGPTAGAGSTRWCAAWAPAAR